MNDSNYSRLVIPTLTAEPSINNIDSGDGDYARLLLFLLQFNHAPDVCRILNAIVLLLLLDRAFIVGIHFSINI